MQNKYWLPILLCGCFAVTAVPQAHSQSIMDRIKAKAKAKADQKQDEAADKAVNAADATNKSGESTATPTPAKSEGNAAAESARRAKQARPRSRGR